MLVDDPVKRVDNMTMAWGLEARVPFLDHELVELAARIPPELKLKDGGKGILKEVARMVIPSEVIDRKKGYFPVPQLKYVDGPYLDMVRDALQSRTARERGLFREDYLDATVRGALGAHHPAAGVGALAGRPAGDVAPDAWNLSTMAKAVGNKKKSVHARGERSLDHRLQRLRVHSLKDQPAAANAHGAVRGPSCSTAAGDGCSSRQTFDSDAALVEALREERPDQRDIAFYVRDPHVAARRQAPQEIFLDPSHTYRLDLATYRRRPQAAAGLLHPPADLRGRRRRGQPHLRRARHGAGRCRNSSGRTATAAR